MNFHQCRNGTKIQLQMKIKKMKCLRFCLYLRWYEERERDRKRNGTGTDTSDSPGVQEGTEVLNWATTLPISISCVYHLLPLIRVGFFLFRGTAPPFLLPSCGKKEKLKRGMADMIECNSRRTAFQLLTGFLPPPVKEKKETTKFLLICPSLFLFFTFNLPFSNLLYMPNFIFLPPRAECRQFGCLLLPNFIEVAEKKSRFACFFFFFVIHKRFYSSSGRASRNNWTDSIFFLCLSKTFNIIMGLGRRTMADYMEEANTTSSGRRRHPFNNHFLLVFLPFSSLG